MNIYLVRHGKTDWNCPPKRCQGWEDIPLNEFGIRQARLLAKRLRDKQISVIYSSHLVRARQTAEIIADRLGVKVIIDKRLAEAKRGKWEGARFTHISRKYPRQWQQWKSSPVRFRFPQGESLQALQRRAVRCLTSIVKKHKDSPNRILIVSHGGPIRAMLCHFKKIPLDYFHRINFPNTRILRIKL